MLKQNLQLRSALVLAVGLSLLCSGAYAQQGYDRTSNRGNDRPDSQRDSRNDNRNYRQNDNRNYRQNENRGNRYHYRDGRWYSRGWFGWEFAVSALAIGAMVESLPPNHSVIVAQDGPYYYDNSRYYRQLPNGAYVVVAAPR